MLKNLKRKFAKVALTVLALQLVFLGLGTGAIGAHADVQEDTTAPTANVTHDELTNTIAYTFSEPVELRDNDGAKVALTSDKLAIFETSASGDYNLSTKAASTITSAVLNADSTKIDIAYGGSLVKQANAYYVVDAWGYHITDLAGNQMLPSLLQVFMVNGDSIVPRATVAHDEVAKTITYSFTEPVQLRGADGVTILDSSTYASNLAIYDRDAYLAHVLGQPAPDTAAGVAISSAVLSSDAQSIVITYTGSLVKKVDSYYIVDAWGKNITDLVGNKMLLDPSQIIMVTGDAIAPVVTMTSKPVIVTDAKKTIEVTFTGNEPIVLNSTDVTLTQGTKVFSGKPATQTDPTKLVVYTTANFFDGGVTPINVAATFADYSGNLTPFTGQIKVDTIAPAAVTGVTSLVNADGSVTISWVNPPAGTFSGVRLVRVGDFTVSLSATVETFTDNTTQKGNTYSYSIVTFDEAGNETAISAFTVTVPAPVVAAAVSDTTSYVAPTDTNTNTGTDTAVKANVTNDDKASTDDSGFPVWGIILLIILALVGGYLIWNQKPALEPVARVETKKKTTTTKKK